MTLTRKGALAALAFAAAVALAGCVATDLTQLNTSYDTLRQKEADAARMPDKNGKEYAQAEDELESHYKSLAASAYNVSQESDQKPATRVAALRLAAVAAWKGGNDDVYGQALPAGLTACQKLPAGTGGAPRDCALLSYLDTLRTLDQLTKTYNASASSSTPQAVATMLGLLPKLDAIRTSQEALLPSIVAASPPPPYAGISPSAQAFFKKVAFASACLAKLYYTYGNTAFNKLKSPEAQQLSDDGKAVAGRFSALLVTADVLKTPNPTWYMDQSAGVVCSGTPQ